MQHFLIGLFKGVRHVTVGYLPLFSKTNCHLQQFNTNYSVSRDNTVSHMGKQTVQKRQLGHLHYCDMGYCLCP